MISPPIPICCSPINEVNTMIAVFAIAGSNFELEVDLIALVAKLAKNNPRPKITTQTRIFVAKAISSFTIEAILANQIVFEASTTANNKI